MAEININIGKDDVLNINVAGTQETIETTDNKEDIEELCVKLRRALSKYNSDRHQKEHKCWWYEVFVDFQEDFEELIYPHIKDMEYEEQFTFCLGYMWRRDSYYFSPQHYDDLNEMVSRLN